MEIKRTRQIGYSANIAELEQMLKYEFSEISKMTPGISKEDIDIMIVDNKICLTYLSEESDKEQFMRELNEKINGLLDDALNKGTQEFYIDCNGNSEELAAVSNILNEMRITEQRCIVSGTPVFDDNEVHQLGIKVFIHK